MRYVSLDLETTGLDPQRCQPIMAALVIEDTDHPEVPVESLPTFACLIEHPFYHGEAYALHMNAWILKALADGHTKTIRSPWPDGIGIPIYSALEWENNARTFLIDHIGGHANPVPGRPFITVAGKNVATFDLHFLEPRGPLMRLFRHRVIDAGSVFVDWRGEALPDLAAVKHRCGLGGVVSHDAVDDARDVIRCLRMSYGRSAL